jgi:phenylpropionate dioxygenase-like ring-hydroxylating dioxygenase large terminal subunit
MITQKTTQDGGWHCVAESADLPPGRLLGVQSDGVELVLWRALTSDGLVLRAWEDVCPHRGAKLSRGLIRDGQLLCYKHAWRFDVDGVRLATLPEPGSARVPPQQGVRLTSWLIREQDGRVLVCRPVY